jgi:hypothetical protein
LVGGRGVAEVGTNELARLASAVERQTNGDGAYDTAVPAVRLSHFSAPSDLVALVYEPSLCVVAQGAKEVLLANETYRLDPARSLLVSVDLPVAARVVEASPGRPYLAVRLRLDPAVVGELLADGVAARVSPVLRGRCDRNRPSQPTASSRSGLVATACRRRPHFVGKNGTAPPDSNSAEQ